MMTLASCDSKQDCFVLEETQSLGAKEALGWQFLNVWPLNVCHLICFQKRMQNTTYTGSDNWLLCIDVLLL